MSQTQVAKTGGRKTIFDLLQNPQQVEQFARVLPSTLSKERFVRIALTTITANPRLMMCSSESLIRCMLLSAQAGLEVDGKRASLVPFGENCTLIFGYQGLVELVKRSGEITAIHGDAVHEGDDFDFCYGSKAFLRHKPRIVGDRGGITCFYSVATLRGGGSSFEVVRLDEVIAIRDASQGWKAFKAGKTSSSVWDSNFSAMGRKTAIRRHCKTLTMSPEVRDFVERDEEPEVVVQTQAAPKDTDMDWLDIESESSKPTNDAPVQPKKTEDPQPAQRPEEPEPAQTTEPEIDIVAPDPHYDEQILAELKKSGLTEKDLALWQKGAQQVEVHWLKCKSVSELPVVQQKFYLTNMALIIPLIHKLKANLTKVS